MAITFVTTTSHGSWLPGDLRGYVQDGIILPSNPRLLKFSKSILKSDPVFFSASDRNQLFQSLRAAADEFNYRLTDVAIESWHLHWIIAHADDPVEATVGRLKTRLRKLCARANLDRGLLERRTLRRNRTRSSPSLHRETLRLPNDERENPALNPLPLETAD